MHILYSTIMLMIFTTLSFPLLNLRNVNFQPSDAVKVSFYISLFPSMLLLWNLPEESMTGLDWMSTQMFETSVGFKFDYYSIIFTSVALFITWSIMEFSYWYMAAFPKKELFFNFLLIFLMSMIILVSSNNLFQLFIGWEGVGIMSFLLINWWHGRTEANTAALQAVLYNRAGDIGMILVMVWFAMSTNSWNMEQIFILESNDQSMLPQIGLVVAATGKSALYMLHPWLPSAMEGPTPVSALLHSSTMVVAGIFLLIRLNPLLTSKYTLSFCLCLGALTTLSAAYCALTQNDMKKIVAFSTSSQLGLMMVAIGLGLPQLAFFHICTHAFFKAMLFMCSGAMIHAFNNEQDIRKMGGAHHPMPMITTYLTIGNMALMGTPFMAGFFSKDAIIEAATTSYLNAWALAITLLATSFTAVYSFRMLYLVASNYPRYKTIEPMNESQMPINCFQRLAWGSIIAGLLIYSTLTPDKTPVTTMPTLMKLSAIGVTLIGIIVAMEVISRANKTKKSSTPGLLHHFSISLTFFPILHRILPMRKLFTGESAATKIEKLWSEYLGPCGIALILKMTSTYNKTRRMMSIKSFLAVFFISLIIMTILLKYYT
nr:NADH dehydrogenase subunit 5 [Danio roseus]